MRWLDGFRLLGSVVVAGGLVNAVQAESAFGAPRIAPFHGGAVGAVSLQFDDSMESQVQNAIPLLNKHHLRATFYVNPSRPQYKAHLQAWEKDVPKAGHEIGNHTMNHSGAKDVAELETEIDKCTDVLAKVWGPKPAIRSFAIPGGVPWNVSPEQVDAVLRKRLLVLADQRSFFDEAQTDPMVCAKRASDEGLWMRIGFHGVGGEWLSTSVPTLSRLVDFLVAHRASIWTAPTIEVYKYAKERDAARPPVLAKVSDREFTIKVDCDASKLETFGRPVADLYDQPLTVEVPVPASWTSFSVNQGKGIARGQVVRTDGQTIARFDVLPNMGPARVTVGP